MPPSVAALPAFARSWILAIEGGLVDDPDDPGKLTKFGISKRSHPTVDIAALTEDGAAEIYDREYWRPVRGAELPKAVALAVFDTAVLQGVGAAVSTLQRALRNLGLDGRDLAVDGLMGPETLRFARMVAEDDLGETLAELLALRGLAFQDQVLAKPAKKRFLRGWQRRLFKLQAACLRLQGEA